METHHEKTCVVVLDEFDHLKEATWQGFYRAFDEGKYCSKRVVTDEKHDGGDATRTVDCSRTIFLLTTNRFDNDIVEFGVKYKKKIDNFIAKKEEIEKLEECVNEDIRPKMQRFFPVALVRRIDIIVPFFYFTAEEAYVITDLLIDAKRLLLLQPPTKERKIGEFNFVVTPFAVGELSKAYTADCLAGVSAISREIQNRILNKLYMYYVSQDTIFSPGVTRLMSFMLDGIKNLKEPLWFHFSPSDSFFLTGAATSMQQAQLPYFLVAALPEIVNPAPGAQNAMKKEALVKDVVAEEETV